MEDPFISRAKGSEIRGSQIATPAAEDSNAHLHKNPQTPESSDESEDSYDDADDRVKHDMSQLEHLFHKKGLNFRMIKRIGEGILAVLKPSEGVNGGSPAFRHVLNGLQSRRPAI